MAGYRNNSDIVKGNMLMLSVGNEGPIGFSTSNSLNLTTNTVEVATKDHGDFPAVIAQSVGWEVTAENLYSDDCERVINACKNKTLVNVTFGAANYTSNGIVDPNGGTANWTISTPIASGQAYITSCSINAPSGDNATMTATFTGVGALSGAQGG